MLRVKPTATVAGPRFLFVRNHSKKKIPVQLHKDFEGLGLRGEVVRVLPGRMRNQLHPYSGASYVLKGKPLQLNLVTKEEALKEKQRRLDLNKVEFVEEVSEKVVDYSDLSFLNFPSHQTLDAESSAEADSSVNPFILHTALETLPPVLSVQWETKPSGFLEHNYTSTDMAETLTRLTGFEISSSSIRFEVPISRSDRVKTEVLDHVGQYNMIISISATDSISRKVLIDPKDSELQINRLRPFGVPLPHKLENLEKKHQIKNDTEIKNSVATDDGSVEVENDSSKKLPSENDFISQLEKRYKN